MRVKRKGELFRKGDSVLPSLYQDMVFAEYAKPILFTCLDEYDSLYICSCYHADADRVEWMLARTKEETVLKLLKNQIPIHDIFSKEEYVYLLTLSERGAQPRAVKKMVGDVPKRCFPTPGYDMEAEDGEFDEEITELRNRIAERENAPYEKSSAGSENFCVFLQIVNITWRVKSRERNPTGYGKCRKLFQTCQKTLLLYSFHLQANISEITITDKLNIPVFANEPDSYKVTVLPSLERV